MSNGETKAADEGLATTLFWVSTSLFVLSWLCLLLGIYRHWTALSGRSAYKLVLFSIAYPLPWIITLGDFRRRKDTTVLLVAVLGYVVLSDAVDLFAAP
jgi:hypothetical protein